MRPEKGFWPFLGFSCPSSSRQAGSPSEPHLYFWLSMASLQAPIICFNMASCKIERWKWKASNHQSSVSTWPVAKLKSESEKPQHSNYPFHYGQLQIWQMKMEASKHQLSILTDFFLVLTFCHFAHRPGLFLLLSLSQSSIWRYEKPTNGNASGNSLLFHHLGHPYWGLSLHVCHKLPAALVPINDLIRALTYDQPTWSLCYISLFLGCW